MLICTTRFSFTAWVFVRSHWLGHFKLCGSAMHVFMKFPRNLLISKCYKFIHQLLMRGSNSSLRARGHVGCWVEFHPVSRTVWGVKVTLHVCHYRTLTHLTLDKQATILADGNFKCIFLNENDRIPIRISLTHIAMSQIVNNPALVRAMAWRRTADKPLPEPMLAQFIDVYIGQWRRN